MAGKPVPPESPAPRPATQLGRTSYRARRNQDGRVRVGIITPSCYLGGAERHISDLLDYCDLSRIEWAGIAIGSETGTLDIPSVRGHWEARTQVATGYPAMEEIAKVCDVLVTWGYPSVETTRCIPDGLPVVEISHCAWDTNQGQCALPGSTVVAVARSALKGIPSERRQAARVIYNAASPARVNPTVDWSDMRRRWDIPEGAKVAGWFGRIAKEKRPGRYIDGIASLPEGWFGVMVGAGLWTAETRSYAGRRAPGRIIFPGPSDDVGSVLRAFDCFVMTSGAEGCCIALGEAWLAGCPAISCEVGLLEERSDLARLLPMMPSGDDIASAILADQTDRPGTMSRVAQAMQFARDELSPERFGREWTELLCGLAPPIVGLPMRGDGVKITKLVSSSTPVLAPTLLTKARNLAGTLTKQVLAGNPTASPEVQAERREICFACDEWHDHKNDICRKCGCFGMKLKRSFATSECPVKKWGATMLKVN